MKDDNYKEPSPLDNIEWVPKVFIIKPIQARSIELQKIGRIKRKPDPAFRKQALKEINDHKKGFGLPDVLLGNNAVRLKQEENNYETYIHFDFGSDKPSIHFSNTRNKPWILQIKEAVRKVMSGNVSKTREH